MWIFHSEYGYHCKTLKSAPNCPSWGAGVSAWLSLDCRVQGALSLHTHPNLQLQEAPPYPDWRESVRITGALPMGLPAKTKLQLTEKRRPQTQRNRYKRNPRTGFYILQNLRNNILCAKTHLLKRTYWIPLRCSTTVKQKWKGNSQIDKPETVPYPRELIIPRGRSITRLPWSPGQICR